MFHIQESVACNTNALKGIFTSFATVRKHIYTHTHTHTMKLISARWLLVACVFYLAGNKSSSSAHNGFVVFKKGFWKKKERKKKKLGDCGQSSAAEPIVSLTHSSEETLLVSVMRTKWTANQTRMCLTACDRKLPHCCKYRADHRPRVWRNWDCVWWQWQWAASSFSGGIDVTVSTSLHPFTACACGDIWLYVLEFWDKID